MTFIVNWLRLSTFIKEIDDDDDDVKRPYPEARQSHVFGEQKRDKNFFAWFRP